MVSSEIPEKNIRQPVVAGSFYTASAKALSEEIENYLKNVPPKDDYGKPIGLISPHAGYMYSGQVAAYAYKQIEGMEYDAVIVIAPSHRAYFPGASVDDKEGYRTPLGVIPVDIDIAKRIMDRSSLVSYYPQAHVEEHSLEVQLPFLQRLYGSSFKIVAITMLDQSPKASSDLSKALLRYITLNPSTLFIASTDLNHYDDHESTLKKDSLIIEAIEANDPRMLYSAVYESGVTMCGYGAVATLMLLEIGKPRVLKHATSGEVSGDFLEVVGYLSVIYE